jgi:hypothetical protein
MNAAREVSVNAERAARTTPRDYALRFVFGGLVTAAVGIVGAAFGPTVAGLFLAFPAILPASVTLIERHQNAGAAGADALGAVAGSVGLVAFGIVVWTLASRTAAAIVLPLALLIWLTVSVGVWWGVTELRRRRHPG